MSSGFASESFLAFSTPSSEALVSSGFLTLLESQERVPFHIVEKRNDESGIEGQFILSPICFSGSQSIDFQAELAHGALTNCAVKGGFLQSRTVNASGARFFSNEQWVAYTDARTNYRIPLNQSLDELILTMRRDSRSRVRKILRERDKYDLSWVSAEDWAVKKFCDFYTDTADRLNFSAAYRFSYDQWRALLNEPRWRLYLLSQNEEVVGGSVICELEQGFDYTFTAYTPTCPEAARAIIVMLAGQLSEECTSFLDLGGGIAEGDALASFKQSMGGVPVQFERMRFAQVPHGRGGNHVRPEVFLSKRWP